MAKPAIRNVNVVFHGRDTEEGSQEEQWDRTDAADAARPTSQYPEDMVDIPFHQVLHTSQSSVDSPGLRAYVDRPNNPEEWKDDVGFDAPEVVEHKGRLWIHDGHHRIIASRLRGERSFKAHFWSTGE